MNILIFGHLDSQGGAQNALRKLVNILKEDHNLTIVLPSDSGSESNYYQSLGITCEKLELGLSLPNFSTSFLIYSHQKFSEISNLFIERNIDFVISNTIAILHGALIANLMNRPHVFYAHESLNDPELQPTCISKDSYIKLISSNSDGLLSCSNFVANQFNSSEYKNIITLSPFDFNTKSEINKYAPHDEIAIQIIGVQSYRKNTHFSLVLSKALKLIGIEAELHIIGSPADGSLQLQTDVKRRNFNNVFIHPHSANPFLIASNKRMITLVAARTEPYGLTIVESLQRGIPVIATNSGGPQELLDDSCLYDFDDLDECVRKIRSIIHKYDVASVAAVEKFNKLKEADYIESQRNNINSFIQKAEFIHSQNKSTSGITQKLSQFQKLLNGGFQIEKIANNISKVSKLTESEMSYEDVLNKISLEKNSSGNAVLEDIKKYDVIPFTYSDGMDSLYKEGFGLAIELAANSEDIARLVMIFYIYSCLIEKVESSKSSLRILALGDGLALDSMRLANCGLNIDYIDYDKSNMAKIAKLNCNEKFGIGQKNINFIESITKKYDAIVCLEVIEHVPIPFDFLNKISSHLKTNGLLFISECFDGIEDRWPTHLHANEKYSNKLPFLANQGLELSRINKNPYGKPYVFKKISRKNIDLNNANLYENKDVVKGLYNAISRIGV